MFSFIRRLFSRKAPKPEISRVEQAKENIRCNYMSTHHERQKIRRALKAELANTTDHSTISTHLMIKRLHETSQKLKAAQPKASQEIKLQVNQLVISNAACSPKEHEQTKSRIEGRQDFECRTGTNGPSIISDEATIGSVNPIAAFIKADSFGLYEDTDTKVAPTVATVEVSPTTAETAEDEAARATDHGSSSSYSSSDSGISSDSYSSSSDSGYSSNDY